jgi:ubiquinone/menaquinone biosynthesis C-methylase UbiE
MEGNGWKPESYSEFSSEQSCKAKKFFTFFGDYLKKTYGDNPVALLDVGTGDGHVLNNIILKDSQLNFSKVVGTDKCTNMVNHAIEKYNRKGVSFCVMDVQDRVPRLLQSKQFDIVTSFYCLHWITDLKRAFNIINSILKPNGLFLCVFLQNHFGYDLWQAMAEKYPKYMHNLKSKFNELVNMNSKGNSEETFKEYLIDCGFEVVDFIVLPDDCHDYYTAQFLSGMLSFSSINFEKKK